jgi:hypothetical protein
MVDFRQVEVNNGTARVWRYTKLNLIDIAAECGGHECEIELTPTQARELGLLLIEESYKLEMTI